MSPRPSTPHPPQGRSPRLALGPVLSALLALAVLLVPAARADEPQLRPLVAAVPASMPPLYVSGKDGRPAGFALEVATRVAEKAGYRLSLLVTQDMAAAELALRLGTADILPGLGVSPARRKAYLFTAPFDFQPVHIFFRSSATPVESRMDLVGRRVALVRGTIPEELLADQPEIHPHMVDTLAEAMFHTLSGETDVMVYQTGLVRQALEAAHMSGALEMSARPLLEVGRAIAVRNDRPELAQELGQTLERFRDTPEFNALFTRWHPSPPHPAPPQALAWIALGTGLAVAAALLIWRYASVLQVNRRLSQALAERDTAMASLRLTEERLNSLLTLAYMEDADSEEIIAFALEEAVRLTDSRMGYLGFLVDDALDPARLRWSREAQRLSTAASAQGQAAPLSQTGLWDLCLETRQPCIVNGYRLGMPDEPTPIARHMSVPLAQGDKVVAVMGVGNKPEPYDEADARQLQLFLTGLWRIIQAKQDAEALRQAKKYAEDLIQSANAMAVSLDEQGNITMINAAATEITGHTSEEALGKNWYDLTRPPAEATHAKERHAKLMRGQATLPRRHEARLLTKNGRPLFVSAQNSLLRRNGAICGLLSFAVDITERRNAEQALAQSEEKFRALAEDSPALICRFLPGGEITYANEAYCRAFDLRPPELVGKNFLDLIPASEHAAILEHLGSLTPDSPARSYEHQVLTPDGGIAWQSWTDRAVFNAQGALTAFQSVGMDITARKLAEEELVRLRQAIEETAEGVVITDPEGDIVFRNPAFDRMTGADRGQGACVSILELAREREDAQSMLAKSARHGTWRGNAAFRRPDGAVVEAQLTVSAMRSAEGAVTSYVALCRDVTETRRLERQLWQAQKMEALGTLAGGIAHDFNNILASIMGFAELALADCPPAQAKEAQGGARQSLERVLKASRRAKELVRQILTFSRRGEGAPAVLAADAVVAEAIKLMEATLPKNVVLSARAGATGCAVMADASQVHQIVLNLCTNAAQAMRHSGGTIHVATTRRALAEDKPAPDGPLPLGDYLELVVEDDGPGIPLDIRPRIFDPFFTTKGPGEGTGLGLAVVHGIVSSLGGDISVEDRPGGGARFTVLLPAAKGLPLPEPTRLAQRIRGRGRILFVDDEPDILDLATLSLGGLGYEVCAAQAPEEALARFSDAPQDFDLVISDQNMPGMPGTALAGHVRSLSPDVPVVLSSGHSESIPTEEVEALGGVLLLPKPYSMSELAEAVRLALARPQAPFTH